MFDGVRRLPRGHAGDLLFRTRCLVESVTHLRQRWLLRGGGPLLRGPEMLGSAGIVAGTSRIGGAFQFPARRGTHRGRQRLGSAESVGQRLGQTRHLGLFGLAETFCRLSGKSLLHAFRKSLRKLLHTFRRRTVVALQSLVQRVFVLQRARTCRGRHGRPVQRHGFRPGRFHRVHGVPQGLHGLSPVGRVRGIAFQGVRQTFQGFPAVPGGDRASLLELPVQLRDTPRHNAHAVLDLLDSPGDCRIGSDLPRGLAQPRFQAGIGVLDRCRQPRKLIGLFQGVGAGKLFHGVLDGFPLGRGQSLRVYPGRNAYGIRMP